jgi:hypothetical protein
MSTLTHPEKILDYIELTGAVLEKSAAMLTEKEAQDKKIATLIPQAVNALLENERILPTEKEAATKILCDPVKVLEILIKTAAHKNSSEQAKLGEPSGQTKKASYNSLNDSYVGRKSQPGESESYKALKRGLGL